MVRDAALSSVAPHQQLRHVLLGALASDRERKSRRESRRNRRGKGATGATAYRLDARCSQPLRRRVRREQQVRGLGANAVTALEEHGLRSEGEERSGLLQQLRFAPRGLSAE